MKGVIISLEHIVMPLIFNLYSGTSITHLDTLRVKRKLLVRLIREVSVYGRTQIWGLYVWGPDVYS